MFPSIEVIKQAKQWGAQLLIVHEPLFYNHYDKTVYTDSVSKAKKKLIKQSGLTIFRFHDHPHLWHKDMIAQGEIEKMGITGKWLERTRPDKSLFFLDNPMTPRQLAKRMKTNLCATDIKVIGSADSPCRRISLCFGATGRVFAEIRQSDVDIVVASEICEWQEGEYARDAALLGKHKAIIVMGHVASERDGMQWLAKFIQQKYKQFETRYFECKELFVKL